MERRDQVRDYSKSNQRFQEILKATIHDALNERDRLDRETHQKHHEWVAERIAKERQRGVMYRSVAKGVAQWSVVGLLSWAVQWIVSHSGMMRG